MLSFSLRCNNSIRSQSQTIRIILGGKIKPTKNYRAPICRNLCVLGPAETPNSKTELSKHVWSKEWDQLSFGATPPWNHTDLVMEKV